MGEERDVRTVGGAESLRDLRRSAGLTLARLADLSGYSISHLSNVERGVKHPSEQLVRRYRSLNCESETAAAVPAVSRARAAAAKADVDVGAGAEAAERIDDFGSRLMRLRLRRGLSLVQMASRTGVSRSYLGNLETGRRRPSERVADICDRFLEAGGSLAALRDVVPAECHDSATVDRFPAQGCADPADPTDPEALSDQAGAVLLKLRQDAQRESPASVLPSLTAETRGLTMKAAAVGWARGRRLWLAAARFAEFTGWMAQEAGDDAEAVRWTRAAARWAGFAGDQDMASYYWERRALIALYRGDGAETIRLAQRGAEVKSASPRARGLAVRRLAQGYALVGDADGCLRNLDAATALIEKGPAPYPSGPSWGPNTIGESSGLVEASCLVDLGRHRVAAELFGSEPGRVIPAGALRTRVRFATRAALAFAGAGEPDSACMLAGELLPGAARVDSATVRADLRRLVALLGRGRGNPRVRALIPDLHRAARCGTGVPDT